MDSTSTKSSSSTVFQSPFASPTAGLRLRKRVLAWSLETGLPASVCISVAGKTFNIHESPLRAKSGYFNKALQLSLQVELPRDFPGGWESFQMVALFCYGSPLKLDPFNVAALRCAAELLEMTESYSTSNLDEVCDLYLNQVAIQSWDDTVIVLQKCEPLGSLSEDLLVASRCIEALAFMACMEILDPETKEIAGHEIWIKDLIALPFQYFKRIVESMRRQGMKEKYVSPIIVNYANKWVLSNKTRKFFENAAEEDGVGGGDVDSKIAAIFEGIVDLLPEEEKANGVIPSAFYFTLLSRSLSISSLSDDRRAKLESEVADLLHLGNREDMLVPASGVREIASSKEFATMERVFSIHASSKKERVSSGVVQLWDTYLYKITHDSELSPKRFSELIEVIPIQDRENQDALFVTVRNFISEHPGVGGEEKTKLCAYIDYRKLSTEICMEAVKEEIVPLRLVIQALFFNHLQTIELPSETETDPESFTKIEIIEHEIMSLKRSLPTIKELVKENDKIRLDNTSNNSRAKRKVTRAAAAMKKKSPMVQLNSCSGFSRWASHQRNCANKVANVFKGMTTMESHKREKGKKAMAKRISEGVEEASWVLQEKIEC